MKDSKAVLLPNQFYDFAGNLCTKLPNGRLRVQTVNNEPSLTVQSEKDSCDINKIVAKYGHRMVAEQCALRQSQYQDLSNMPDYQTALNDVAKAQEFFEDLPSNLRKRFRNDPLNLLSFLDDPNNRHEAIALGLIPSPQDTQIPQGEGSKPAGGDVVSPPDSA